MKRQQLIVMMILICAFLSSEIKHKSAQKNRGKAKVRGKTRHKNLIRQKHRYNSDKILKKYRFSTSQDGAAAPAEAAPAEAAPAKAAPAEAADPNASDASNALAANGAAKISEDAKILLKQRENQEKADDVKKMIRDFKTLAEPTKIFTEGTLDLDKPHLILENADSIPQDYDLMESTKECEYKEGYLAYITDIRMPKLILAGKNPEFPVMRGIAVLAVLNKDSLSLFDKEHVNSLLRTYDIKHLTPYVNPTEFGELKCFQLISSVNFGKVQLTMSATSTYVNPDDVMATLCCANEDKLYEWRNAITKFSNCKVEIAQDETVKVENTFDTIQNRARVLRQRIHDDEKVSQEYSKTSNAQELLMVQKYVENMKKAVADEVNNQNQQKREMTVKLENDIKKSVGTTMQEECLQKALQIQEDEEARAVEQMINAESETREEEELKKQQDELIKNLKNQGKNIALQEESLDETVQKMTKQMQYNMVQSVESFERTINPDICDFSIDQFPKGVKNLDDRRNYVCTQLIDPQAVDIETINDCMVPEYFCDVCCNYNIGPADEVGREKCVQQCRTNYGSGETNMFELTYILEVNPKVLKNYLDKQTSTTSIQKLSEFFSSIKGNADAMSQLKGKKKKIAVQYKVKEQDVLDQAEKFGISLE